MQKINMTMKTIVLCALLVLAISTSVKCKTSHTEKKASRRSIGEYHEHYDHEHLAHYAPYHSHYPLYHSHYAPYHTHSFYNHHHHQPIVYQSLVQAVPTATTVVHKPVPVPVPHPVPVPVARPVPVEVPRPYPVEVPRPYPVAVNRPFPVHVIKPVPVPVAQPYPVTVYKPYPVPVYRPLPVAVAKPAVAVQYAARLPVRLPLRYNPQPSYSYHGHAAAYAHHHAYTPYYTSAATYAPNSAYSQAPAHAQTPNYAATEPYIAQTAHVNQLTRGVQNEYEVNEQTNEEDYSAFQESQEANLGLEQLRGNVEQDIDTRYPPLTNGQDVSLAVPNTDYANTKKK
ncbi:MAGE-like protein 2 [Daktulosphaira vitifoliae]|uniref:MAGE-like protein 2 n=1 Tax=Daktulosphaira vitifoliae TaxID=58002 RepID=UPI0021AAB7CD|nr:MAGE-like protein 2 [Daktulosphaira vitifoliae]